MDFIRTPEKRFERLLDYPFDPHYVELSGLRMHYVDEGPAEASPVLMMHGEPSWSYLYRHMVPVCAAAGHRVIAPDLIGFGKSDKPTAIDDYSYQQHMDWMQAFIDQLELENMTLVCQDWGSLLGLRLAARNARRKPITTHSPWFPIARIINTGSFRKLGPDERRAYDAPFPNKKYKAGARAFPRLVPMHPNDPASEANRNAWRGLERWEIPFLTAFSNGDPITRGGDAYMQKRIPGAKGQPHVTLKGGHFLQEDSPVPFARAINNLLATLA